MAAVFRFGYGVAKVDVALEDGLKFCGFVQADRYRDTRPHNRVVRGPVNRFVAVNIKKLSCGENKTNRVGTKEEEGIDE